MSTPHTTSGRHLITAARAGYEDVYVVATRLPDEDEVSCLARAATAVAEADACIVGQEICVTAAAKTAGLQRMPVVLTNNVVCRDDLLFEIEVDAVR